MKKFLHIILKKPLFAIGGVAVIAIAGYAVYSRTAGTGPAVLIVHPTDFVNQITVSGKVVAAESVDLGFNQTGRVAEINAQVGDKVAAGSVIASLENGDLRAALLQKEETAKSEQANLDALKAGTRPEQIAITQSSVAAAQSALDQADQELVNAIVNAYTQSDDAVHNKIDQFIANPHSTNPQLAFSISDSQLSSNIAIERLRLEGALSDWRADIGNLTASARDFAGSISIAQSNLNNVAKLLSDANDALNIAVPGASLSQDTINSYKASVSTARASINTAVSTLTSAITAQTNDAAALLTAQKNLKLEEAGSTAEDIAAAEAKVNAAEADILAARANLDKTVVVAPFSGVITKMDAKAGEITSPAVSEISMISTDAFQIETYVPEVNIAAIKVGQDASATLDAYGPGTVFAAKVISIDPAETVRDGVSTYKVKLQFAGPDARIKSGMTASVAITIEKESGVLVVPRGAVFEKGGERLIQVKREEGIADVPVTTSDSSAIGNVRVISGLADGDSVILNPDTSR